jgi:UDP-N-acetylmuramate dehydrogenase
MVFPSIADRLPAVRGSLVDNAPLAPATWFRVGGPAQALFLPADEEDLAAFLAETPADIPVAVLGAASNVIVRDGGIPGVVVRLTKPFAAIATEGTRLTAGAAALDKRVAAAAADAGIAGLEFYAGVPGTIGGAVRMNAGCYGAETKDVLVSAIALDRTGRRVTLSRDDLGYSYRHSEAPESLIFIAATFEGRPDGPDAVRARMAEITARREESQPIREKTGGSTFANPDPPGTLDQRKSWELIDKAGGRGLQVGGARMSDQHCNFMINTGDATADDLEALGEEIRRKVRESAGVTLAWEIRRIGVAGGDEGGRHG